MQHLPQQVGLRRAGALAVMVLLLIVGSSLGIIFFATQGSLWGVVFAALVPGYVVGWVLEPAQAARLPKAEESR